MNIKLKELAPSGNSTTFKPKLHLANIFRRDSSSLVVILVVAFLALTLSWDLLDHATQSWDQSNYLNITWRYQLALSKGGLSGLVDSIYRSDPGQAPLFTVEMLPFFYLVREKALSGFLVDLFFVPILLLSAAGIAGRLFKRPCARPLAVVFTGTMPLMIGLSHAVLQDYSLATLAALTLYLLIRTDFFTKRLFSLGFAFAAAAGTLTKVTFPLFVLGPIMLVVIKIISTRGNASEGDSNESRLRWCQVRLISETTALYLLLIGIWYVPNAAATYTYFRSTTSGPLALGAGPTNPFTFHAILGFSLGMVNNDISWIIVIALVLSYALLLVRKRFRNIFVSQGFNLIWLTLWFIIPYLTLVFGHNQDVRLIAPAMPSLTIALAGIIAINPSRIIRVFVSIVSGSLLVSQMFSHTANLSGLNSLQQLTLSYGGTSANLLVPSDIPIGYESVPSKTNYMAPVLRYLETEISTRHRGSSPVCMLESDPIVNGNTVGFLLESQGYQNIVLEITTGSNGSVGLQQTLSQCTFALYVRQPETSKISSQSRLVLVNNSFASDFMTSSDLALFSGPNKIFPIGAGQFVTVYSTAVR